MAPRNAPLIVHSTDNSTRLLSCLFREFRRDIFGFAAAGLFDIDLVTDQPQLKLVERGFPAHLEIPHPLAIFVRVFDVDYYFGGSRRRERLRGASSLQWLWVQNWPLRIGQQFPLMPVRAVCEESRDRRYIVEGTIFRSDAICCSYVDLPITVN